MATGAIALEKLQAGLEAIRGTAVAATRKVYTERGLGWFEPIVEKEWLAESMSSYIANYRHIVVGQSAKLTVPFYVTASDLAWWGQIYWAAAVTAVTSAVTVQTYTFNPVAGTAGAVTADNVKAATFEASSDTQGYQFPFCLGEKLEISWQRGKAVMGSAELLAQQAIPQAITGAIADRTGLNALAGTTAQVFIDNGGGTIGTTAYANVLSGKLTWQNLWELITHNKGQLYYDDAVREPREVALELDIHFKDTAETAHLLDDAERLIRVQFTGPVIPGSTGSVPETVKMDFYGHYQAESFAVSKAIRTVKLTGKSQFDTTAGFDWNVACATSVPTLP